MLFQTLLPEIFFISTALMQLFLNTAVFKNSKFNVPLLTKTACYQTLFILLTLFILFVNSKSFCDTSYGIFQVDAANLGLKLIVVLLSIITLFLILPALLLQKINFYELFSFYLFIVFSLLLILCSQNLLSFYVLLEMQTICFYVLSAFNRKSAFSTEAGLKYFISGSFMSGCFLLGSAILFSFLGTLNLQDIYFLLIFKIINLETNYFLFLSMLLITSTLLFKIACAPFHFWAPDVYEGAPLSSTLIFSIIPKLGLIYFFMKWIFCLGFFITIFQPILLLVGIFSCLIGTLSSFGQKRLKRLVIFSSIAQTGFIVAALALNSLDSSIVALAFLLVYLITSILIWGYLVATYYFQWKILSNSKIKQSTLHLTSFSGLFYKNNLWALSFILIFFSIAGIPPLTGFLTKILIFSELINSGYFFVAILLIIISSVSVYYYIRIIKVIFFEPNSVKLLHEEVFQVVFTDVYLKHLYLIFTILLFGLIFIFLYPTNLLTFCTYLIFKTRL